MPANEAGRPILMRGSCPFESSDELYSRVAAGVRCAPVQLGEEAPQRAVARRRPRSLLQHLRAITALDVNLTQTPAAVSPKLLQMLLMSATASRSLLVSHCVSWLSDALRCLSDADTPLRAHFVPYTLEPKT
jgi:hypothetical protein